jgi:beta-glucosidase
MVLRNALAITSALLFLGVGLASASTRAASSERVESILAQMTTEQKVGQVLQGEIKDLSPSEVKRFSIGSVLNGGGSFPGANKRATLTDWVDLAQAYWEAALVLPDGTRVPPIWGTDAVHGHNNVFGATLFPHNIGLGAAGR